MALVIIDVAELKEMREELDHLIHQADAMNATSEDRIDCFHDLNLPKDMEERILNALFSDPICNSSQDGE